jgi:hypothetical protein
MLTLRDFYKLEHCFQFNNSYIGDSIGEESKNVWSEMVDKLRSHFTKHMLQLVSPSFLCLDEGRFHWEGSLSEKPTGAPVQNFNPSKPAKFAVEHKQLHDVPTRLLLSFDLHAPFVWKDRLSDSSALLSGSSKVSSIQVLSLIKPFIPNGQSPLTQKPIVSCDAAFGNVDIVQTGQKNNFHIVANLKQQTSNTPKQFLNTLDVSATDSFVLKTVPTPSDDPNIFRPIFLTKSKVYKTSITIHSLPSAQNIKYRVLVKQPTSTTSSHSSWQPRLVPSVVAYYLNTYNANDIHNFHRSHFPIENLWNTNHFKIRYFIWFLNCVLVNTYCAWRYIGTNLGHNIRKSVFGNKFKTDFIFIR